MEKNIISQSTAWSAVSEFLSKLASPLANIILARLLVPEVFGLVATFTLVTSFAEVFTDAGFQKYLVQHEFRDNKDREQYTNVAFWTNLGFSVVIWVGICIFRDPIAEFVGSPGCGLEISVLSFQIPLYAFSSIQNALYRRDFRFKELVPIRFASSLVPLCITVPLAFFLRNTWSIIIGSLAKELVNAVLLTIKSTWKPGKYYSVQKLRDMLSDCLWLLGDSIMIWLTAYAPTFIVTHALDSYYTGIFRTGTTAVNPYISLIYTITSPVLFSALSRLQNDKAERDKVYLDYQKFVSYLVIPLGVAVFIYRDTVTTFLLGNSWMEASLLIGFTGLSIPLSMLTAQYNSVYFRAAGRADIAMMVQGTYSLSMIVVMLWAVQQPFEVLSMVGGSTRFLYVLISVTALAVFFKIRFSTILRNIAPAACGTAVFAVVAMLTRDIIPATFWWQIVSGCISVLAYSAALLLIPESRHMLLQTAQVQRIVKRLSKNPKKNDEGENHGEGV